MDRGRCLHWSRRRSARGLGPNHRGSGSQRPRKLHCPCLSRQRRDFGRARPHRPWGHRARRPCGSQRSYRHECRSDGRRCDWRRKHRGGPRLRSPRDANTAPFCGGGQPGQNCQRGQRRTNRLEVGRDRLVPATSSPMQKLFEGMCAVRRA